MSISDTLAANLAPSHEDIDMEDQPASTLAPTSEKPQRLPVTVTKPIPYTFDLGNLLCNDTNPIPQSASATSIPEAILQSTARDCAQALLNQILSTCAITPSDDATSLTIALPAPTTLLPREKRVPEPKTKTKWEAFAEKKGIGKGNKDAKSNLVFDQAKGEWVPRWGYKGQNKNGEGDWLVEVDEKKERASGEAGDARSEKRAERKERVRRQDRRERANQRKTGRD